MTDKPNLIEAARALDAKLCAIHVDPLYQSVWQLNQVHQGPYKGPQYVEELSAMRKALFALPADPVIVPRSMILEAQMCVRDAYYSTIGEESAYKKRLNNLCKQLDDILGET